MHAITSGQVQPTLRQLLLVVGDPLADLYVPEGHLDATLARVAILDPDDDVDDVADALVLAIGTRGRQAARQVRAAAARGASAVAVKLDAPQPSSELLDAAREGGVALLGVQPQMRWEQLAALVQEVRAGVESADAAHDDLPVTGLFALAETVAELTQGSVTIEDPVARVLAYSRSSDEADELRRQTILGLQGPEPYLALLREWGVYRRIRDGDEVVRIEERAELGIRGRLVVGIGSGQSNLGTIWVAEGDSPLADDATETLRGAARVAEEYLVTARPAVSPRTRDQRSLLARTLDGSTRPDLVADRLGIDLSAGCVVVAVSAASRGVPAAELVERVAIGASAYWPTALVTSLGTRIYILLADAESGRAQARAAATGVVTTLSRGRSTHAVAGVGAHVPVSSMVASRAEADRVASALERGGGPDVATLEDMRAEILLGETLQLLAEHDELDDPAVARLREHDATHRTSLCPSLLAYLQAFGDVRQAAAALYVHPNTLRHRLRRVAKVAGIDLDDPAVRLLCHLRLLTDARTRT